MGLGFSYLRVGAANIEASLISIPLYANYYFYPNNHRPFLTAGLTVLNIDVISRPMTLGVQTSGNANGEFADSQESELSGDMFTEFIIDETLLVAGTFPLPMIGMGYEYRSDYGILIRATAYGAYVPIINQAVPWAGISLGSNF